MKIEKGKINKVVRNIFCGCLYIIVAICILYNIIFSINTAISQKDYFKLFGISFFRMKTDLMKDDINKNDFIIVKEVNENELQEGDIIAYQINGKTRINKIFKTQQGEYTTKSNKNYYPDIEKISYNQIIGKKVAIMPFLGIVLSILQSKITTAFILIVLILYFLRNKYLYEKRKERARKKKKIEKGT